MTQLKNFNNTTGRSRNGVVESYCVLMCRVLEREKVLLDHDFTITQPRLGHNLTMT